MGRWRALRRRDRSDAGMDDEMRFHIEMEAGRLVRERGLDPREARRQAHVAFGGVEKYKEAGRDIRRLGWLDALSLDARLGVRMLVKHRGLTIVRGFAMAVAIAVGAVSFEVISEVLDPGLPSKDGNRVVALQAPPVVVIGFQEWQTRFAADSQITGRSISLGGAAHTVVGVMPEGFRFPVDHQFWTPLRVNPLKYERLRGPALYLFGRLALRPAPFCVDLRTRSTTGSVRCQPWWQRSASLRSRHSSCACA